MTSPTKFSPRDAEEIPLAEEFGFAGIGTPQPAQAAVAIGSAARDAVTVTYRVRRSAIVIPSTTVWQTVADKRVPRGWAGKLLAVGHEANANVFDDINWRITVNGQSAPGFGGQLGIQWGTINTPGPVYAFIGNGSTVALEAMQTTGSPISLSALIIGYSWPVNNPAIPVGGR